MTIVLSITWWSSGSTCERLPWPFRVAAGGIGYREGVTTTDRIRALLSSGRRDELVAELVTVDPLARRALAKPLASCFHDGGWTVVAWDGESAPDLG